MRKLKLTLLLTCMSLMGMSQVDMTIHNNSALDVDISIRLIDQNCATNMFNYFLSAGGSITFPTFSTSLAAEAVDIQPTCSPFGTTACNPVLGGMTIGNPCYTCTGPMPPSFGSITGCCSEVWRTLNANWTTCTPPGPAPAVQTNVIHVF